jgi:23S rRNA (guanine2445-N2)-methyltransferase / 23S rRNA (guanine2069-N7)-methyltransferase
MESLLAEELAGLGASGATPVTAGVAFRGDLAVAYRACLWSRLASRVLLPLAAVPASSPDELYAGIREIPWEDHLSPDGTLAVDFTGTSPAFVNTLFGARRVKDAVVDRFRDRWGRRPSVDLGRPDLRLNVHLAQAQAEVRLDLSGESLHQRGYRLAGAAAPLKENLAAAVLIRAGWPGVAAAGGFFLDPMCGSGTLPVEAALMAADIAPGLLRPSFGFLRWPGHDEALWGRLREEALARREAGLVRLPPVAGSDRDREAVKAARENVRRAGLEGRVTILRRELAAAVPLPAPAPGLVAVNPPYGERLGSEAELRPLYEELGKVLREGFPGHRAAVLTGNPGLAMRLGIRARRRHTLFNGALECVLFDFAVEEARFMRPSRPGGRTAPSRGEPVPDLANRLRRNLRLTGTWADREGITCWRLYDADLPEYAAAVDLYRAEAIPGGGAEAGLWAVVQEYRAPKHIDPDRAARRLAGILATLPEVLDVPPERIVLKVRHRQQGGERYGRQGDAGRFLTVAEGKARYLVNLHDYLDTGLFLDARPIRRMLEERAAGARFLNLFGYTGTATVAASLGGAASTLTVDLSRTYLDWAGRNLALNGIRGSRHRLERADCRVWLAAARGPFDLIYLDPPTFSSSKRMEGVLDVQRDHGELIRGAVRLLSPDGLLVFATNLRTFRMDGEALQGLRAEDVSRPTIPRDFARDPRAHVCWLVRPGDP